MQDGDAELPLVESDDAGLADPVPLDPVAAPIDAPPVGAEEPVDPADEDAADLVHGDPDAALRWAETQLDDGLCAITSVSMVAARLLGGIIDQAELVELAQRLDYLDDAGMTLTRTRDLLEHLGIPARVERGDLDTLRVYLRDGRGLILAVDAGELSDASSRAADPVGTDHAVVIVGIDDRRGVAFVHDPGRVDGAGLELSLERLLAAWDDSGYQMVVTEAGVPAEFGAGDRPIVLEVADAGDADPVALAGYVLLPVSVAASALAVRRVEGR